MRRRSVHATVIGIGLVSSMLLGPRPIMRAAQTAAAQRGDGGAPRVAASAGPSPLRPMLDRYCVSCHNGKLKTAGLLLDTLDANRVGDSAAVWEKVLRKVNTQTMPPTGMPKPDTDATRNFVSYLEAALDRAAEATPEPGRPAIHRLNRDEYANAVRDLLGLEVDTHKLLPADDSGYGFDNIADSLRMSSGLLERYLSSAKKISRLAVGDPSVRAGFATYSVSKTLVQNDRMSEDLPFGSRGGMAVEHYFPVDGEYVLRIRLQKPARAFTVAQQIEVRLDRALVRALTVGGGAQRKDDAYGRNANSPDDGGLELRVPIRAGRRIVGVAFVTGASPAEELTPARLPLGRVDTGAGGEPAILDSLDIGGPFSPQRGETASRRTIFICQPSNPGERASCARTILSSLARRAYRRPVTEDDIQTLLRFYEEAGTDGDFDAGIRHAIERLLVDPSFLFRVEHDPPNLKPGTPYRISDLDLASRLSFFLWSSIPDEALLRHAERGTLRHPTELQRQVQRMLADPRAKAMVTNFGAQWLGLRKLTDAPVDQLVFPEFDDNLRRAIQRETGLFLDSQLREDHSVVDLLTADYTFVDERLARHYEMPNVYGSHFRRVTVRDARRRGLLGQAGVLMASSYANRTSPTLRGKYVLDTILGAPPPPPPPDVPGLKEDGEGGGPRLSVRKRLDEHRKNPVCASCHARMDPLGFALENFDAIGRWRVTEAGSPIDASGSLPDGTRFVGPVDLRTVLVGRSDEFVTALTEKLLTYALGRELDYYDQPVVRTIVRQAAHNDYRWSSIVSGIVASMPFQMRRSAS